MLKSFPLRPRMIAALLFASVPPAFAATNCGNLAGRLRAPCVQVVQAVDDYKKATDALTAALAANPNLAGALAALKANPDDPAALKVLQDSPEGVAAVVAAQAAYRNYGEKSGAYSDLTAGLSTKDFVAQHAEMLDTVAEFAETLRTNQKLVHSWALKSAEQLGVTLPARNQPPEALDRAKHALPPDLKGPAETIASDPKEAAHQLAKVVSADPNNEQALALLSRARLAAGDRAGALDAARRAAKLDPNDPEAQALVAELAGLDRAKERVDSAKPDFGAERAPQEGAGGHGAPVALKAGFAVPGAELRVPAPGVVPPTVLSLFQAAHDKLAAGDDDGALLALHEAVDLDPKRADAWETIADILNKEGDFEGAIAAADKALAIDPKDARALRAKSYAEFNKGDYRAALADAERAVALDPANGLGYLYRAMAEERLGDKAAAIRDYKTAEKLDPALMPAAEAGLARLGGSATEGAASSPRSLPLKLGVVGGSGLLLLLGLLGTASGRRVVQDYTRRLKTLVGPKPVDEARGPVAIAESETVALGALIGGHYRITGELGRGGMGAVYRAQDETLQRPVAVKRLLREARASRDDLERLLKEARLVAQLRHPNIAEIYSVIGDRDPMLVFEFIDGESLDKTLKRRARFSPSRAKEIIAQTCSALEYAHGRHIVHRDLKPGNVMFVSDGTVKVMDFGIAHQSATGGTDTRTNLVAGTPPYMAPEQGMGSVSKASDLYALGVMGYELLTGSRPFGGPDFLEPKLRKEFLPATQANPALPGEIDAFFARALEPDPIKRFASAAEFRRAFDAALDGVTTEA